MASLAGGRESGSSGHGPLNGSRVSILSSDQQPGYNKEGALHGGMGEGDASPTMRDGKCGCACLVGGLSW
jgi:hypothetical protein